MRSCSIQWAELCITEPIFILNSFLILLLTHTFVKNLAVFPTMLKLHIFIWMPYLWGLNIWENVKISGKSIWRISGECSVQNLILRLTTITVLTELAQMRTTLLLRFIIIRCAHDCDSSYHYMYNRPHYHIVLCP